MHRAALPQLAQQLDGSWVRNHPGAAQYNEIVVGTTSWDASLPSAVEAFLVAASDAELAARPQVRLGCVLWPADRNTLGLVCGCLARSPCLLAGGRSISPLPPCSAARQCAKWCSARYALSHCRGLACQPCDFCGGSAATLRSFMTGVHCRFLRTYNLSSEAVPLLRYRCSQDGGVVWDAAARRNRPAMPKGACFQDVSEWSAEVCPRRAEERVS